MCRGDQRDATGAKRKKNSDYPSICEGCPTGHCRVFSGSGSGDGDGGDIVVCGLKTGRIKDGRHLKSEPTDGIRRKSPRISHRFAREVHVNGKKKSSHGEAGTGYPAKLTRYVRDCERAAPVRSHGRERGLEGNAPLPTPRRPS